MSPSLQKGWSAAALEVDDRQPPVGELDAHPVVRTNRGRVRPVPDGRSGRSSAGRGISRRSAGSSPQSRTRRSFPSDCAVSGRKRSLDLARAPGSPEQPVVDTEVSLPLVLPSELVFDPGPRDHCHLLAPVLVVEQLQGSCGRSPRSRWEWRRRRRHRPRPGSRAGRKRPSGARRPCTPSSCSSSRRR